MKTGRGSSLYEVLKNASRQPGEGAAPAETAAAPPAEEAAPAAATLQERLAAYKAAKLAAAQAPAAVPEPVAATVTLPASAAVAVEAPPAPAPKTLVLTPDPTPPPRAQEPPVVREKAPAPVPAETTKLAGPGERVLKVTYNTAVFAVLVVVGVVFIAYALGLRTGRASVETESAVARPVAAPAPVAAPSLPPASPPAPKREFTLRLAEWKYGTSQERLKANAAADELKQALERAGHRPVEKAVVKRGEELKLALYLGAFTELQSEATRNKLATIRAFKVKTTTPFSQAAFEEAPSK
jgi:hypothetical protein